MLEPGCRTSLSKDVISKVRSPLSQDAGSQRNFLPFEFSIKLTRRDITTRRKFTCRNELWKRITVDRRLTELKRRIEIQRKQRDREVSWQRTPVNCHCWKWTTTLRLIRQDLTSCAGITCHARRELFVPKLLDILSVLSIFKYNPGKTNNKFITSQ